LWGLIVVKYSDDPSQSPKLPKHCTTENGHLYL
jgi:hypothetical protein